MSRTCSILALTLVGALVAAVAAQAQPPGEGGPRRPGGMGVGMLLANEKVAQDLKLTDEQKGKIRNAGRELGRGDDGEKKLAEILKPEQTKRLKQIQLQLNLQFGAAAALARPEVAKELGLSEEQISELKSQQEEARAKARESMAGMRDLSQEERRAKRAEMRPKMEEARKEAAAKALGVLKPEQKEKLETMKGAKIDIDLSRMGPGGPRREGGRK